MTVSEELQVYSRIEFILVVNAFFYLALGVAVICFGFYTARTGATVDLVVSVDLLVIAVKGFLIGSALAMLNEVFG